MSNQPNPPSGTTAILHRTVRGTELVEHLDNFRRVVDRYHHVMPSIILGVPCGHVINMAIDLTIQIETLKEKLVQAMLDEGIDPYKKADFPPPPIEWSHPAQSERVMRELEQSTSTLLQQGPPQYTVRRPPGASASPPSGNYYTCLPPRSGHSHFRIVEGNSSTKNDTAYYTAPNTLQSNVLRSTTPARPPRSSGTLCAPRNLLPQFNALANSSPSPRRLSDPLFSEDEDSDRTSPSLLLPHKKQR
jgi:hypothetical protein